MYNQTLPHRDEAMAQTWECYRNVAMAQVSWHSKNGTQPSFPVCTKGNASDCLIISKIRQVACISRHHSLFLPWTSFPCTTGKTYKILMFHAWFLSPQLLWSLRAWTNFDQGLSLTQFEVSHCEIKLIGGKHTNCSITRHSFSTCGKGLALAMLITLGSHP